MPEKSEFKRHEGKATARTRRMITRELRDWYGSDAEGEILKYLPQPAGIGDLLDRVVRKRLPKSRMVIFSIRTKWAEIAGEVTAKRTRPFCYRDNILDIEVNHPAFLAALRSKTIRETILQHVRAVPGAENCTELRFIPAGRLPPQNGDETGSL